MKSDLSFFSFFFYFFEEVFKMDMKNIGKQFMKWAPVIGMAIVTSVIDQKTSDKERADLKKEILKELREEME